MDTITRDIQREVPWTLLYADDVMLTATTRHELQSTTQLWSDKLSQWGLKLNAKKTEYLETHPADGTIQIDGVGLEKTNAFRYLGSTLAGDGTAAADCNARISAAWSRWRDLTGVLCDKKMPLQLKAKLYKAAVRPVALYGTECWPTTKAAEQKLHKMEMNMLRWTMGVTRLDRFPNDAVRASMGVAPIHGKLRQGRLRWYGHVMRAKPDSVAAKAHRFEVQGRRPRGAPRKRWRDNITTDMQLCGLRDSDASERDLWRRTISVADPAGSGKTLRR